MRNAKRTFLIEGDPAYAMLLKWQAVGIWCKLDALGTRVVVQNCTWPEPGTTDSLSVSADALAELGQWHDEILSHLRYWKETREQWEHVMARHNR